jgi:fatty-acyl-CoA synthase
MIRTDWLERWALYAHDKIAVKDDTTGKEYSYAEIHRKVNKLSRVLQSEFLISHGERVAVLSMNTVEYLFLYFAVQQIGGILVPINYRLAPREIEYIMSDCSARLIVFQQEYLPVLSAMNDTVVPSQRLPMRSDAIMSVTSILNDVMIPDDPLESRSFFNDPCMILYTSGTTGKPKGALITNAMVFWNSVNTTMRLNLTENDVTLTFAPFFHTGGWHVLTTPFLHRGARIVFLNTFTAERVVELCDSEGVTVLFGVPTMMKMMAETKTFPTATFKTVRFAIVGGEPMPIPQIELWQRKGVPIRQGYGLTEVGPNCFSLPEEDAIRKKGSIGFPNFYIDAKIVDDHGNICGPNSPGELLLRSPVVTPGYWNNPQSTEEAIRDGWFHTGDIVRRDDEGYYYVVDRKKDMFISGAENVYPAEVEHFLYTHPGIAEVAVIGVPDAKWGEVGKAYVAVKPGVSLHGEEILHFCAGKLAKFKIPKYVEIIDALPKGHSGKILKRALIDLHNQSHS